MKFFCYAAIALTGALSAFAAETTVVSDVLGAEGPLYVGKLSDVDSRILEKLIAGSVAERRRRHG
jgi:hypothetical protein